MNRRGFLTGMAGILAVGVAPGIVRADSLMRIVARPAGGIIRLEWLAPNEVFDIGRYMRDHSIQPGPDGCYVAMVSPAQFERLIRTGRSWASVVYG